MNHELLWQECLKYAKDVPYSEHTQLRSLRDLEEDNEIEVKKFEEFSTSQIGMILSSKRDENGELKCYIAKKMAHAAIIGSSGSGKSQGYGYNMLYNLNGSISCIVSDPKGEYYSHTYARLCEVYGEENVGCIDFMQPWRSKYHINFLMTLAEEWLVSYKKGEEVRKKTWEKIVNEIRKYLDVLFVVTSERDPTWEVTARNFIFSLVIALFEDLTLDEDDEPRNSRGLSGMNMFDSVDRSRNSRRKTKPEQINFETVYKIFHSFEWSGGSHSAFKDGGFLSGRSTSSLSYQLSKAVINNAGSTRANYLQFVENFLKEISDPKIAAISAYNDFDFKSLAETPKVVFMAYDLSDMAIREYVNKIVAQNIGALLEYSHKISRPLTIPVLLLLEEFPTLKACPIYPNILATGRGSNIFMHMIMQSYTQLEARYPRDWTAMIENCDYTVFVGTNDMATAQKFSNELGMTTCPDPIAFLQGSFVCETKPVVSQDYLMHRMQEGEVYIKIHHRQPIHGHFEHYYKTKEYNHYPQKVFELQDTIESSSTAYQTNSNEKNSKSIGDFADHIMEEDLEVDDIFDFEWLEDMVLKNGYNSLKNKAKRPGKKSDGKMGMPPYNEEKVDAFIQGILNNHSLFLPAQGKNISLNDLSKLFDLLLCKKSTVKYLHRLMNVECLFEGKANLDESESFQEVCRAVINVVALLQESVDRASALYIVEIIFQKIGSCRNWRTFSVWNRIYMDLKSLDDETFLELRKQLLEKLV